MKNDIQLLRLSAWLLLFSTIIGGPLLVWVVQLVTPQPPWTDPMTFARHYHWIQSLPYWAGFILIGGNTLFVVASARLLNTRETAFYSLALIFTTVYATLAAFNYIIQTGFIPVAVKSPSMEFAVFSMENPNSFSWTIEMFAYAILGIALWLIAPGFKGPGLMALIRRLIIFDAVVSILGVGIVVAFPGGMLDSGAFVGYVSWNGLVATIAILILYVFRTENNFDIQG